MVCVCEEEEDSLVIIIERKDRNEEGACITVTATTEDVGEARVMRGFSVRRGARPRQRMREGVNYLAQQ